MEITYLGQSSFKFKNKSGLVTIVDPFSPDFVGLPYPKEVADILVISHEHEDHNFRQAITGPVTRSETFVIDAEGEYEVNGTEVSAIRTWHDKNNGADRGKNLVTVLRDDGLVICHLGDLGQKLTESMIEKIGSVDILMVPVGGEYTLTLEEVGEVIKSFAPSLVVPMHFKVEGMKGAVDALLPRSSFMEKNKWPLFGEPVHKIKLEKSVLPDDTSILVMNG